VAVALSSGRGPGCGRGLSAMRRKASGRRDRSRCGSSSWQREGGRFGAEPAACGGDPDHRGTTEPRLSRFSRPSMAGGAIQGRTAGFRDARRRGTSCGSSGPTSRPSMEFGPESPTPDAGGRPRARRVARHLHSLAALNHAPFLHSARAERHPARALRQRRAARAAGVCPADGAAGERQRRRWEVGGCSAVQDAWCPVGAEDEDLGGGRGEVGDRRGGAPAGRHDDRERLGARGLRAAADVVVERGDRAWIGPRGSEQETSSVAPSRGRSTSLTLRAGARSWPRRRWQALPGAPAAGTATAEAPTSTATAADHRSLLTGLGYPPPPRPSPRGTPTARPSGPAASARPSASSPTTPASRSPRSNQGGFRIGR
jgi:hypothetical protein